MNRKKTPDFTAIIVHIAILLISGISLPVAAQDKEVEL